MSDLARRSIQRSTLRADAIRQLQTGGIAVDAVLGRAGVLDYRDVAGNLIREYRSIEEVSDPASLESLKHVTVTVRHPAEGEPKVTSTNYRDVVVGHVGDDVRVEGDLVYGTLYVQDEETVQAILDGLLIDLSPGYSAHVLPEPGVTDDGIGYDARQTVIRYNHIALLGPGEGRQGPRVSLRIDDADAVVLDYRVDMDPEKIKAMLAEMLPGMMPDMETLQESLLAKLQEMLPELLKAELAGMGTEVAADAEGEEVPPVDGEAAPEEMTDEMTEEEMMRSDSVKRRIEVIRAFERATGEVADLSKSSAELLQSAAKALDLSVRSDSVDRLLGAVEAASAAKAAAAQPRSWKVKADAKADNKETALKSYVELAQRRQAQLIKASK